MTMASSSKFVLYSQDGYQLRTVELKFDVETGLPDVLRWGDRIFKQTPIPQTFEEHFEYYECTIGYVHS